jgi:hypothetical protein
MVMTRAAASVVRLPDDQLERLADMIAARVHPAETPRFVDAAELASIFGVSVDAIYDSADSLGAIRVGRKGSQRPRIVFDVQTALTRRARASAPPGAPRPKRGHIVREDIPLLPIKDKP